MYHKNLWGIQVFWWRILLQHMYPIQFYILILGKLRCLTHGFDTSDWKLCTWLQTFENTRIYIMKTAAELAMPLNCAHYRPCAIMSSMASSTLALRESSLARSSSSWAGDNSNSIPVILLANACQRQTNVTCPLSGTICLYIQYFTQKRKRNIEF